MLKRLVVVAMAGALCACGNPDSSASAATVAAKSLSLPAGTVIHASILDSLNSRVNKPDERVRATVASDVVDKGGRVIVPSGTPLTLRIVKLEPGSDQVRPEGRLELELVSVTLNGTAHPLTGSLGPIPHTMKGRGITKDEAGRIAAGTAIGAGIGQVIGKNTKSTVIGGAVGAVAGGAVAVKYAYRDVVVAPGAKFDVTIAKDVMLASK